MEAILKSGKIVKGKAAEVFVRIGIAKEVLKPMMPIEAKEVALPVKEEKAVLATKEFKVKIAAKIPKKRGRKKK